jgi:ADP-ribose pyrophosphatase YjhB (NUDIX family)
VQTVLREIEEESGLRTELLTQQATFGVTNLPVIAPPEVILLEPTTDGVVQHEHIDLIYFCRPVGDLGSIATDVDPSIRWVTAEELERNEPVAPFPDSEAAPIPDDVRILALAAIRRGSTL